MPPTSESPPSRWPRYLPKQFSIGAMLVLITVVACFLWWYVQLPVGTITKDQAAMVRDGMTKTEVLTILGDPAHRQYPKTIPEVWIYKVNIPVAVPADAADFSKAGLLVVFFSKGDARVTRSLHAYYDHDDHE